MLGERVCKLCEDGNKVFSARGTGTKRVEDAAGESCRRAGGAANMTGIHHRGDCDRRCVCAFPVDQQQDTVDVVPSKCHDFI